MIKPDTFIQEKLTEEPEIERGWEQRHASQSTCILQTITSS